KLHASRAIRHPREDRLRDVVERYAIVLELKLGVERAAAHARTSTANGRLWRSTATGTTKRFRASSCAASSRTFVVARASSSPPSLRTPFAKRLCSTAFTNSMTRKLVSPGGPSSPRAESAALASRPSTNVEDVFAGKYFRKRR